MKHSSFIVAVSLMLFLSACWGGPANDGSSSSSSSSSSAVAEVSSAPVTYSGEFKQQPDGSYLGSVTLTGYATTNEIDEPFCESDCKKYRYVFFNITHGMTPELKRFAGGNDGNAYVGNDSIGIGCVSDDGKTIVSDVADLQTHMVQREINEQDSQVILKSNARNLVTITLNRDYEPAGSGAPACYSHFEYVTVTD